MATPRKRHRKNGPDKWEIAIRKSGYEAISGTFDTKAGANEFNEDTEDRIAEERRAQIDPSSTLPISGKLEDEKLLETISLFKKTGPCIKRHDKLLPTIVRHIGAVMIGQLKPSWIAAYIVRMRKQKTRRNTFYAYESIVAHLHMINVVIKWRAESLNLQPPRFVIDTKKLPRGWANKRTRRLEDGEELALMNRLSQIKSPSRHHWMLLVRLAIETGARLQELLYAEWREISPGVDFWTIPASHTKCKTERVMPLTSGGVEIVVQLQAISAPHSQRIFHALGKPDAASQQFHRWAKSAGLIDLRFHDLRHEGISRFVLTQRKFTVYEIMQMVGHSSPAMLQRYSNLRGDELAQKIIRTIASAQPSAAHLPPASPQLPAPPNMSSWGINAFGYNFAALRSQAPPPKLAAPIYGVMKGINVSPSPSADPQQQPASS